MGIGALSHVGVGKESTWGTPVAATDYVKFNSETITHAIEEVVSAQLGRRDEPESYEGLNTIAGETVQEVHPNGIGYLLRSFFNAVTSNLRGGGTLAYKHEFQPSDTEFSAACAIQPYTLEIHRDLGDAFQYSGMVVNSLAFSFGVGAKILMVTSSWLGKSVVKITKTTPSLEATDPFRWNQAVISIGGSANNDLETLGVTLNNGLVALPTLNNTKEVSRIMGDAFRSGTLTGTFIVPDDDALYWTTFKGWATKDITVTLTGALIEGAYYFTLKFILPKVLFTAYPINVGGPGRITAGVTAKIKYDSSSGYFCKMEVTNTKTAY